MDHLQAAEELEAKYPRILDDFHRILRDHGMPDMTISSIQFALGNRLVVTSGCPPGTVPVTKCVALPGGGVRCSTVCVRQGT